MPQMRARVRPRGYAWGRQLIAPRRGPPFGLALAFAFHLGRAGDGHLPGDSGPPTYRDPNLEVARHPVGGWESCGRKKRCWRRKVACINAALQTWRGRAGEDDCGPDGETNRRGHFER